MIKDVFTLKTTSWHYKLMTWIWPFKKEDFTHMCPYFWLGILNVIISPFVLLFKAGLWIFSELMTKWCEYLDIRYTKKRLDIYKECIKDSTKQQKVARMCHKEWRKFEEWLRYFDSVMYHLLSEQRDRYIYEEENIRVVKVVKPILPKERINKIVSFVKPVMRFLLVVLGLAAVCLVSFGLYWLVIAMGKITNKSWMNFLIGFGEIVGIVVVIIGIGMLLSKIKVSCKTIDVLESVIYYIAYPFIKIGQGAAKVWILIREMIKGACPAIKWEE